MTWSSKQNDFLKSLVINVVPDNTAYCFPPMTTHARLVCEAPTLVIMADRALQHTLLDRETNSLAFASLNNDSATRILLSAKCATSHPLAVHPSVPFLTNGVL